MRKGGRTGWRVKKGGEREGGSEGWRVGWTEDEERPGGKEGRREPERSRVTS